MKPQTVLLVLVLLVGCSKEPSTAIIDKVDKDGAGDVRTASTQAIQDWMRKRGADYAIEIWRMCTPVAQSARANWRDSTEGRICQAADSIRLFNFDPNAIKGDPRKYQGGTK
jgi:hypothetical protein